MMREVYRKEKRRIRYARWSYLAVCWILYLIKLQGQIPSPYAPFYKESLGKAVSFDGGLLILMGIFLLLFINNTLFFIQEQGNWVYVLEKYMIVPIHKKKLYNLRVRIFLETIVCFVIGVCGIYMVITIVNDCIFSPMILFLSAIKLLCILVILMILILVFESRSWERQQQRK